MKDYFYFFKSLGRKNNKMLLIFIFFMFLTSLLDVASVSMILPFLNLFNQTQVEPFNYILKLINKFFLEINFNIQLLGIIILSFIFLIKNFFLVILFWFQAKFIYTLRKFYSLRILNSYLNRPYFFYIKRNTSELLRILIDEVHSFTGGIREMLLLGSEFLILFGLVFFLLFYKTKLTVIIIFTLLIFSYLYFKIVSSKLYKWGKNKIFYENNKIRIAKESFEGIKEIKLSNSLDFFLNKFSSYNNNSALMVRRQSFLDNLPRITLEVYFVLSIIFFCLFYYINELKVNDFLITLAVFVAVGIRLIPTVSKIFTSLQNLKYKKATFQLINREIYKIAKDSSLKKNSQFLVFENNIALKNISYKYPNTKEFIIKNINLEISRKSIVGLVGKSGVGKSTLLNIITGLISPTSGNIFLDGKNVKKNLRSWQNSIGYVPQKVFLTDGTPSENIAFGVDKNDVNKKKILECLEVANLKNFKTDIKFGELGKKISGGQTQRFAIARALYFDPKILIFDEGFNSLDEKSSTKIIKNIKKIESIFCTIIVSHNNKHLKNCDTILKLVNKKLTRIK